MAQLQTEPDTPDTCDTTTASWLPIHMTTQDGLRLSGRHYPAPRSSRRAVVCLAGLTRNVRDFDVVAAALSSGPHARDVYCLDMRGRGGSDHDTDWRNYTVLVEMFDVQDFMTVFGLHDVALIGTSRGGLIGMGLAATQPTRLGAIVLNDIGPVIEPSGLARISGYVGQTPVPATWNEAVALCRKLAGPDFPDVGDAEWAAVARQWFNEENGHPAVSYDPDLAKSFLESKSGIPDLWPLFGALKRVPCLTLRGALSDLFSEATLDAMAQKHPRFRSHTVPQQGHAPLLRDPETIEVISTFLVSADLTSANSPTEATQRNDAGLDQAS
ncbi:MAG: alpha/beta hydrolase [Pseudomonadota bacterium]